MGKELEHLEKRAFVGSSSENFDCFSWSEIKNFEEMEPVFLQEQNQSSVCDRQSTNINDRREQM